jgi:hypothetical protein
MAVAGDVNRWELSGRMAPDSAVQQVGREEFPLTVLALRP